jgi:Fe-S oxidoreductase
VLAATLGVDPKAPLPTYYARTARRRLKDRVAADSLSPAPAAAEETTPVPPASTRGRVALFTTCYGNRNDPHLLEDLVAVFEHNGIEVRLTARERCCGMPWLELGDLQHIAQLKAENIPELTRLCEAGFDIVAPVPSCVLMFKQELPLMFPEDADVQAVRARMFDPFEYLMLRHKAGLMRTDFKHSLGKVSYHVPCHLRVQNIGLKTRDVLRLAPQTTVEVIERCSGHDGTYGVKRRFRAASERIGKPVAQRIANAKADHYASDCPMAGEQIESLLAPDGAAGTPRHAEHPLRLLRLAYGI